VALRPPAGERGSEAVRSASDGEPKLGSELKAIWTAGEPNLDSGVANSDGSVNVVSVNGSPASVKVDSLWNTDAELITESRDNLSTDSSPNNSELRV